MEAALSPMATLASHLLMNILSRVRRQDGLNAALCCRSLLEAHSELVRSPWYSDDERWLRVPDIVHGADLVADLGQTSQRSEEVADLERLCRRFGSDEFPLSRWTVRISATLVLADGLISRLIMSEVKRLGLRLDFTG